MQRADVILEPVFDQITLQSNMTCSFVWNELVSTAAAAGRLALTPTLMQVEEYDVEDANKQRVSHACKNIWRLCVCVFGCLWN